MSADARRFLRRIVRRSTDGPDAPAGGPTSRQGEEPTPQDDEPAPHPGTLPFKDAVAAGIAHRDAGDLELALPCWERAWEAKPSDLRSALNVVQIRRKTGRTEGLVSMIDGLIADFPDRAEPYREMARTLYYDDEVASLPYWEEAFQRDPEHLGTRILLIRLYIRLGQSEKAWPMVADAHRRDPQNDELLVLQVRALTHEREFGEAHSLLERAIEQRPDNELLTAAYGRSLIEFVRFCQQEATPEGRSVPISLAEREHFLSHPVDALSPWNEHPAKSLLDRLRSESATAKKSVPAREGSGPTRLLIVSDSNWNFMRGVVEHFDDDPDFEVRTLEFADVPSDGRVTYFDMVGNLVSGARDGGSYRPQFADDAYYVQLIDWADVIWVEWCNYPALWLSWFAPSDTRIVVRMHSYEAFVWFPHLVNWGNVDVLVNVAGHIENFLREQIDPSQWGVTRLEVLPNHNDLEKFDRPRPASARTTLGMAGYNTVNKNPLMALDILRRLRETDDSWTLHLIGRPWPDDDGLDPAAKDYKRRFDAALALPGIAEAVTFVPFTEKLEDEMPRLGYIVSCSDREGTHETVLQGMAAGCVPIVRRWPLAEPWIGDRRTYDEKWWVGSADEAAARIREIDRDGIWDELSESARSEAMERFDSSVVMPGYRSLLLGE